MKLLVQIALALIAVSGTATAADKPDFSGEWKMNPAKSDYQGVPAPSSFIRKITHVEPTITILEEQKGGANGDSVFTRKITTDGQVTKTDASGAAATCTAVWDKNSLVANTVIDGAGLSFKDAMSLSDDRKVLTSKVLVDSPQGSVQLTIVFDRQ